MTDRLPLCKAPWITTYREQNGTVSPCCESMYPYEGVHSSMSNQDIFTHPEVEKFKQQLLEGVWPERCFRCKTQEEKGITRNLRSNFNHQSRYEYDENKFHMRHLDHRSSNVCNFSCKMCGPTLSSTHAIMEKKHGKKGIIEMPADIDTVVPDITELNHLQFAGGEPLLMDSTWELMEKAIESGKSHQMTVGLITNGSLLHRGGESIIEKIKQFRIGHITVSIDGIGDAHDYWRHKGTWQAVEQNMEDMISAQDEKFEACIRTTLGWPTAYRAIDVYKRYNHRVKQQWTGIIEGPDYFSLNLIPPDHLKKLSELYKDFTEPYTIFTKTYSMPNKRLMQKAINKMQRHDAYHGNSFEETFPEWKEFIDKNKNS